MKVDRQEAGWVDFVVQGVSIDAGHPDLKLLAHSNSSQQVLVRTQEDRVYLALAEQFLESFKLQNQDRYDTIAAAFEIGALKVGVMSALKLRRESGTAAASEIFDTDNELHSFLMGRELKSSEIVNGWHFESLVGFLNQLASNYGALNSSLEAGAEKAATPAKAR